MKLNVTIEGQTFEVDLGSITAQQTQFSVQVDGETVAVTLPEVSPVLNGHRQGADWLVIDDRPYEIVFDRNLHWIKDYSGQHPVSVQEVPGNGTVQTRRRLHGTVKSPIPGQILNVYVAAGEMVETGQPLLVLEAMKMANEIRAPRPGVVTAVNVMAGQKVLRNTALVEIE